jgi:hypothetical protein
LQKRQQHNSFTMKEDSNKHSIYEWNSKTKLPQKESKGKMCIFER